MTGSAHDAIQYSFRLLACRARSEKELRERLLRKGFGEAAAEAAVARLKQSGFLDDALLADQLKRQANERKLLGISGTRLFLRKRGIAEEIIDGTLAYDEEQEVDTARRLLQKRVRVAGAPASPADRNRLYQFLARRGYASDIIRRVLREYDIGEEE
ncbi:MAG: RecX family transcriptional regulator [Nitrospiraceae bacterium]|nr:RecX family transcriptional regulator [Nitrospiraceae bacterium]